MLLVDYKQIHPEAAHFHTNFRYSVTLGDTQYITKFEDLFDFCKAHIKRQEEHLGLIPREHFSKTHSVHFLSFSSYHCHVIPYMQIYNICFQIVPKLTTNMK